MTPEIRRELETQLIALRDLVEKRFLDGGNIHWKLGDTLNFIRARIISETPEADRRHLESIIPKVAVERPQKGEGEYTVSSHEGFRLYSGNSCRSFRKPSGATSNLTWKQFI